MTPARFPREVRGPAPISTSLNTSRPQAALPPQVRGTALGSQQSPLGGPGTSGSRGRLRKARESQEAALPRHPRRPPAPGSPCPPGHPPATRVLALLAPGRPPPPSLPLPALAPPGPAPDTHLRRLRAGRTAAFQRSARSPYRRNKAKSTLVRSGPMDRTQGAPGPHRRRRPEPPQRDAGGGGARARSPAGEQRGAGMGPRASWVSGDRSAGGGPGPAT